MRINELMDWIAAIAQWSFKILEVLGNGFNWLIIVVISILAVVWIKKMADFNKEAARNGTLK